MQKVALVTGGTGGIGQAIVKQLVEDDYFVLFTYNSDEISKEYIESNFKNTKGYKFSALSDISRYNEFVSQFDQIDLLVNNLGITNDKLIAKMDEDDFMKVIDINLNSCFKMSKVVIKKMSKQKSGNIINISSVIGITGNIGQANYAASKAGMIAFSKSLAKEYARKNVRVNTVAPGFIKTNMTDKLDDKIIDNIISNIPLKRMGEGSDVANLVSFLASDQASFITGQTIVVDGGMI